MIDEASRGRAEEGSRRFGMGTCIGTTTDVTEGAVGVLLGWNGTPVVFILRHSGVLLKLFLVHVLTFTLGKFYIMKYYDLYAL